MDNQSKIKRLENMFEEESSVYRKVYILATINKLKVMIPKKIETLVINNKIEESKNIEKIKIPSKHKTTNESRIVVEIKDNQIVREWKTLSLCSQELDVDYNTLSRYCTHKIKNPRYNIMRKSEYLEKQAKGIVIENFPKIKPKISKEKKIKIIVQIKNNKIIHEWDGSLEACKDLKMTRQGLWNYLHHRVKRPKVNVMFKSEFLKQMEGANNND